MRFSTCVFVPLVCLAVGAARGEFVGVDDFNAASMDSSKWAALTIMGSGSLTQGGDGVLRYSAGGAGGEESAAWIWQPGTAPFSSDWTMQLDVTNPRAIGPGQFFNIGIGVRNTAHLESQGYSIRLDATDGSPPSVGWETDKEGVIFVQERRNTDSLSGALLLTWSASAHTMTAAFDDDGSIGGYAWTAFSTYDPTLGETWSMTAADSFTFVITAASKDSAITLADGITADNFSLTAAATTNFVPEPGQTGSLVAVAAAIALNAAIRRRRGGPS